MPIVPGPLLRFPDDVLEQEWRKEANKANERGDVWWFIGLIIWSISIVRRWQDGGSLLARNIWFGTHLIFCIFPMLWKFIDPKSYTNHHIAVMSIIRCLGALGVCIFLVSNQNFIWKPEYVGCPLTLFVSQYMKLAYLICQVLAHQVPFIHHIWLIVLNLVAVLLAVPGRCQAECSLSVEMGECSIKWLEKLAVLYKFWIFSASSPASLSQAIGPWQACAVIQALFAVIFAIGPPLLYYATVEENWRKNFLLWRGGVPNFYELKTGLFFDTLLSFLVVLVSYNAIRLFI